MKKLFLFTIIIFISSFICSANLNWKYENAKGIEGVVEIHNRISEEASLFAKICEPTGFSDYYLLYPVIEEESTAKGGLVWAYEGFVNAASMKKFLEELSLPRAKEAKVVHSSFDFYSYYIVYRK